MVFRFGTFELDREAYSLVRAGEPVHLRPRLFDVLVYLIEHRDQVVSYTELLDRVWAPEPATASAVHWTVSKIRKALGQDRSSQDPIETIPRRGYRFAAPVVEDRGPQRGMRGSAAAAEPLALADGGSDASDFVGREHVLRTLEDAFAAARAGNGGLYVLLGEPGIGKSRCVRELASRLGDDRVVWSSICEHNASGTPLWPWLQVLQACAGALPDDGAVAHECRALLDVLQRRTADLDVGGSGVGGPFARLDRIRSVLLSASAAQARVIILDDLQEADTTSLDLLGVLAPKLASSRLLVVGTLRRPSLDRETEIYPRLYDIRARARCIELPPWSRQEVAVFVAKSFPSVAASREAWVDHIWRRSGGNPLFAQELARLQPTQDTTSDDGPTSALVRGHRALSGVLQDLVRRRLTHLPPAAMSAVAAASVIGRSFSLALLQRATEQPVADLLPALDAAQRSGVIEPGERASEHYFRHELIRDAVYTELPGAERSRLHGRVGVALEDAAFGPVRPNVLAWHFYSAAPIGHAAKAVHYAMRAARDARGIGVHADAVRYCEWALEAQSFCPELDPESRCEILLALGRARIAVGEATAGRRHLVRAIEIAEAQGLPRILAAAGAGLRRASLLAALPDAVALRALEGARTGLPKDELALRSLVAAHLACLPPHAGRTSERQRLLAEARELASEARSRSSWLEALRASCQAATAPDDASRLLELAHELERDAESAGAQELVAEARLYRYLALLQLGRIAEGDEVLTDLLHAMPRTSSRDNTWFVRHLDARRAFAAGRLDAAAAGYDALRPRRARRRAELAEFHWLTGMTFIHLERGTSADYWRLFTDRTFLWRRRSIALSGLSLRMLVANGRMAEAKAELELIPVEALARKPLAPGQLGQLALIAMAASALRDAPRCRLLYAQLAPYATRHATDVLWFSHGSVSYTLGLLAEACDDVGAAVEHFEVAVRDNTATGYRPQAAWSRLGLAHALRRQRHEMPGAPDTSAREQKLLSDAELEARDMQLVALLTRLERERDTPLTHANDASAARPA
jgi:DNA-binding winged helix-turn-helix (wHTH) protein